MGSLVRSSAIASLALALAISACGDSREKGEIQVPPQPPPEPVKRVSLTVDTIDAFIDYVGASGRDETRNIREQLDAARTNPAIIQGLLGALPRRPDADMVLVLLAHIGSPLGIDVIHEMIWRPLEPPPTEPEGAVPDELLKATAAEALACIADDRAQGLTDEIIRSHPSRGVRDAAYQQRLRPHCFFPLLDH